MSISVVVPVGPYGANKRWLDVCIESLKAQTLKPDTLVLIDDMAQLPDIREFRTADIPVKVWKSPWLLGVAHAFNVGVAIAPTECVFMLGSDDWLEPDCLQECLNAYVANKRADAYYWVGVKYSDGRPNQFLPCHAAMVTKGLWRKTGGLPIESSNGACDAALVSILWKHHYDWLVVVNGKRPLYNYRVHDETDTAGRSSWQGVILSTRNILTETWREPHWGRTA